MTQFVFYLFVAAQISHLLFLVLATHLYSPSHRKLLWPIHVAWNGLLWAAAFVGIILLQFRAQTFSFPIWLETIGLTLTLTGVVLVSLSLRLLGFRQAMGLRFFFPKQTARISSGVYRFLQNPMYDGFILIFAGLGLALGITVDFALAFASFLVLNIVLARVENYKSSWNPF